MRAKTFVHVLFVINMNACENILFDSSNPTNFAISSVPRRQTTPVWQSPEWHPNAERLDGVAYGGDHANALAGKDLSGWRRHPKRGRSMEQQCPISHMALSEMTHIRE